LYDHIAGRLVRKDLTEIVVQTGGVGYVISIPVSTYEKLPGDGDVFVYTHLAARENDLRLYGFATLDERMLFRILLGAKGIGPAGALGILSGTSVEQFARSVIDEDYEALSRIRGVGPKTARRIVAEIKEEMEQFGRGLSLGPVAGDAAVRDAVMALVSLGLPRAAARKGAEAVRKQAPKADVEEIVRLVLRDAVG
jgi:Holliday junction DNA helicase RuvA